MSFQAMGWATRAKVANSNQRLVLLMLANRFNNETKIANASHATLAEDCCMSVSTLKKTIKELEVLKLVIIKRRSKDGVSLPNLYILDVPRYVKYSNDPSCSDNDVLCDLGGGADYDPPQRETTHPVATQLEVGRNTATKQDVINTKKHTKKESGESVCVCVDFLMEATGMPKPTAVSLEVRYGEQKIRGAIALLEAEVEKGTPIRSKTAWIKTALKEGWEAPSTQPITEPQKTQPAPQSVNPAPIADAAVAPMTPERREKFKELMAKCQREAASKRVEAIGIGGIA